MEYGLSEDNIFLSFGDMILTGGEGFKDARTIIALGEKLVAEGEEKIEIGQLRLDAGRLKLSQGREELSLAKGALISCAFLGAFFVFLAISLGIYWCRSYKCRK